MNCPDGLHFLAHSVSLHGPTNPIPGLSSKAKPTAFLPAAASQLKKSLVLGRWVDCVLTKERLVLNVPAFSSTFFFFFSSFLSFFFFLLFSLFAFVSYFASSPALSYHSHNIFVDSYICVDTVVNILALAHRVHTFTYTFASLV